MEITFGVRSFRMPGVLSVVVLTLLQVAVISAATADTPRVHSVEPAGPPRTVTLVEQWRLGGEGDGTWAMEVVCCRVTE